MAETTEEMRVQLDIVFLSSIYLYYRIVSKGQYDGMIINGIFISCIYN